MVSKNESCFKDFLPIKANKLGVEELIRELCNGFRLLMDGDKRVIMFESLKRNVAVFGLLGLNDGDMVREGDLDGDRGLTQMEFCVLMFRLSPDLMELSQFLCLVERFGEGFGNRKAKGKGKGV
ncbi:hypothetical protein ACSBR2_011899 [Camellia fascicularis]